MKRKKLLKELARLGVKFVRHGAAHDVYSNGVKSEMVPRHVEVDEDLAKKIIKAFSA